MVATHTLEDIAKHNTEQDCWIIFKNKVYDVSSYLDDHPGGVEIITDLAGQDSTEDFEDVGHSEEAYAMLDKYYIGDVGSVSSTSASTAAPTEIPKATEPAKPAPVATTTAPVPAAAAAAPRTSAPASYRPPQKKEEDNSAMYMIGGAIAVAGLAYFLLRKKTKA